MSEILISNPSTNLKVDYNFLSTKEADFKVFSDDLLILNDEICRLFEGTMSNGIIAVNESGIILSFNSKAEEAFGYSAREVIGKNISDLILLEYSDKLESCIVNFVKIKGGIKFLDRLCEISEKYEDDSIIPVKFFLGKIHLDDRLLISITVQHAERTKLAPKYENRLIKKLREIDLFWVTKTDELGEYRNLLRKEMDKRKHAEDKLRLSQAMSSIDAKFIKAGRVAEQMAHDFNNLLVPLQTLPKLLKSRLQEDSELLEYCNTMEKVAHRLMQINSQLLTLMTFNRQEALVFDVNMILMEAANLVGDYLKDDFTINSEVPKEKYPIKGRPEQIYRIFFNVLLYTRDSVKGQQGNISVKSEKVVLAYESTQNDPFLSTEYAKIVIHDDGPGIPHENLYNIFDPFYSSTENGGGQKDSGLALAIVKDMVREHNGFVEVDSVLGRGTVFSIHLPILSEEL